MTRGRKGGVSLRLRWWLFVLDVLHWVRAPQSAYLWAVGKASDADDWADDRWLEGPGAEERAPW